MRLSELKSKGTYVAVVPTPETQAVLAAWADESGLKLDDKLHVTIIYSRVVQPVMVRDFTYTAVPLSITPLGTSALVIRLFCPPLSNRHEELMRQGHTRDFDPYLPHITLVSETSKPLPTVFEKLPLLQFWNEYTEQLSK